MEMFWALFFCAAATSLLCMAFLVGAGSLLHLHEQDYELAKTLFYVMLLASVVGGACVPVAYKATHDWVTASSSDTEERSSDE